MKQLGQEVQIAIYGMGYKAGKISPKWALRETVLWPSYKFRPTPTATLCRG